VLVGLMRSLLCHLSYAAVPGAEQKTYRVTRQASSDPRPRGAQLPAGQRVYTPAEQAGTVQFVFNGIERGPKFCVRA
jgi:hypothetical protein